MVYTDGYQSKVYNEVALLLHERTVYRNEQRNKVCSCDKNTMYVCETVSDNEAMGALPSGNAAHLHETTQAHLRTTAYPKRSRLICKCSKHSAVKGHTKRPKSGLGSKMNRSSKLM